MPKRTLCLVVTETVARAGRAYHTLLAWCTISNCSISVRGSVHHARLLPARLLPDRLFSAGVSHVFAPLHMYAVTSRVRGPIDEYRQ